MEASEQNEPLTSPADVCASNSVAPEPERKSFVEEMQDHIEVMLKMSRQLPPKGMQDPETEGTVFQRFLLSLIQTVRHSKVSLAETMPVSMAVTLWMPHHIVKTRRLAIHANAPLSVKHNPVNNPQHQFQLWRFVDLLPAAQRRSFLRG